MVCEFILFIINYFIDSLNLDANGERKKCYIYIESLNRFPSWIFIIFQYLNIYIYILKNCLLYKYNLIAKAIASRLNQRYANSIAPFSTGL